MHDYKDSSIDPLTGLHDRQSLEKTLKKIIDDKSSTADRPAFCFLDIDDFEYINDNFGIELGEKTLKVVAENLEQNIRPSDMVFRWEEDEFVLLICGLNSINRLKKVLERLRAAVNESYIEIDAERLLQITMSFGATFIREDDDIKSLSSRAKTLMEESRKRGKNEITTA